MFVEGTLEGFNLPVCPDFKDGVTVELEPGTSGGSKMWLGKDYSNPIKRDFFDVHKPYEGTPEGFFRAFCVFQADDWFKEHVRSGLANEKAHVMLWYNLLLRECICLYYYWYTTSLFFLSLDAVKK